MTSKRENNLNGVLSTPILKLNFGEKPMKFESDYHGPVMDRLYHEALEAVSMAICELDVGDRPDHSPMEIYMYLDYIFTNHDYQRFWQHPWLECYVPLPADLSVLEWE